jgi:hypothetical protein
MAFYLIQLDGTMYANVDLFTTVVAGGERQLVKMLSTGKVRAKELFDQTLYAVPPELVAQCRQYRPEEQNFDEAYKGINVISKETVKTIRAKAEAGYPNATVITIPQRFAPPLYKHRHVTFFRVMDYKAQRKYRMLDTMASVKVCGRIYVAINAVAVRVETPIIVTIDG